MWSFNGEKKIFPLHYSAFPFHRRANRSSQTVLLECSFKIKDIFSTTQPPSLLWKTIFFLIIISWKAFCFRLYGFLWFFFLKLQVVLEPPLLNNSMFFNDNIFARKYIKFKNLNLYMANIHIKFSFVRIFHLLLRLPNFCETNKDGRNYLLFNCIHEALFIE